MTAVSSGTPALFRRSSILVKRNLGDAISFVPPSEGSLDVVHFVVHFPSYRQNRTWFHPSEKSCLARIFVQTIQQWSQLSVRSVLGIGIYKSVCRKVLLLRDRLPYTPKSETQLLQVMNCSLNVLIQRYWLLGRVREMTTLTIRGGQKWMEWQGDYHCTALVTVLKQQSDKTLLSHPIHCHMIYANP